MKRNLKFNFWQPSPNEHESGWIKYLSDSGYSVSVYFMNEIPDWRSSLGLGAVNYGSAELVRVDPLSLDEIIENKSTIQDVHFFTGIKEYKLNKLAFQKLTNTPALLFYISESKDQRGIYGLVRFIRDIFLDKNRAKRVNAVLAMGELGVNWFKRIGFPPSKIFEFAYSVADFNRQELENCKPNNHLRLVFVGQLNARKNIKLLIDAVNVLKTTCNKKFSLDIFGTGDLETEIENYILQNHLDGIVHLNGVLGNDILRRRLFEYDVLILPSRWDGWGAVVNEALLSGCRVCVSSRVGAATLLGQFDDCFIFKDNDLSDLVSKIQSQISIGPISCADRFHRIRLMKSSIGEAAIGDYLLSIVDFSLAQSTLRPITPWNSVKPQVVISYHFLPHYRKPIFNALLNGSDIDFHLMADENSLSINKSIKSWLPEDKNSFILTPVVRLFGKTYFQKGLIHKAIFTSFSCWIFLADPNNLSIWIAVLILRLRGIRVLFWGHGWLREKESSLKRYMRNIFFSLADGLLLYGRRSKGLALTQGFDPSKIWVVYNSLDYVRQKSVRERLSSEHLSNLKTTIFGLPDIPVVVCISRVTKLRRLDILLKSVSILKNEGVRIAVLIIGDGDDRQRIESMAEDLNLDFHCTGELYDEEVIGPLISMSTVGVAPGQVGLTAMHCMAYGVPVISHGDIDNQMPESESIIPGVTGDFFEINDEVDLALCLRRWTKNAKVDDRVRNNCIAMIERFYNPAAQFEIILDAVNDVVRSRERGYPIQEDELWGWS